MLHCEACSSAINYVYVIRSARKILLIITLTFCVGFMKNGIGKCRLHPFNLPDPRLHSNKVQVEDFNRLSVFDIGN